MDVQAAAQWKKLSMLRAEANDVEQEWQVPQAPGAGWRPMRHVGSQLAAAPFVGSSPCATARSILAPTTTTRCSMNAWP